MATATAKRTTRKKPSAAARAAAEEAAQRAIEQEREKTRRWGAEGVLGRVWQIIARPGADSLRAMYAHVFVPWHWGAASAAAIAVQEAAAAGEANLATLALVAAGAFATANLAPPAITRLARTERLAHRLRFAADHIAREPGHARVVANVAAAGAVAVHAAGMAAGGHTEETLSVLGTGGLLTFFTCSARYWQWHRHNTTVVRPGLERAGDALTETEAAVEDLAPTVYGRLVQRWPHVSAPGKVLEGAELINPREAACGASAYVQLGESTTATAVISNLDRVAAGLHIPAAQLLFEEYDPEDGEPDPTMLSLRVLSSQNLRRPVPLDDGRPRAVTDHLGRTIIRTGPYVDGEGETSWLLYEGSSMRGGIVVGVTGSGKSNMSNALFMGMMETGCTFTIYIDPKGGQSSPEIADYAHWADLSGEPEQWERIINGLVTVIRARGKYLKRATADGKFHPSPEFPGINLIFDEFYEVSNSRTRDLVKNVAWIARKGRSVGVSITLLTQGFDLSDFGGVDAVRSNVGAANAFSFKLFPNQGSIFHRAYPRAPHPSNLPDTEDRPHNKGLAVALKGRSATMRAPYEPDGERLRELVAAAADRAVPHLDPFSADALDEGSGGAYGRRHVEEAEAAEATDAEIAERVRRGRVLNGGAALRTGEGSPGSVDPAAEASAAGRAAPPALPDQVVVEMQAWRDASKAASAAEESVLRVLSERGPLSTMAVVEALKGEPGCSEAPVKRALAHLAKSDWIAKDGRKGAWRLL